MYAEAELIERLRLICGESHLLTSAGELAAYRAPVAVVLPGSVSEVVAAVTACSAAGISYRVRGAGTVAPDPLSPAAGRVVLGLARLRRLLDVDLAAGTVTAEPGAPVAALRRAVGAGRTVIPELAGSPSATIGGVLAAGTGRGSLAAVDLLMPDAKIARVDANAPGYDLCGAFVGSAGQSGIAVRVKLRVVPETRVG